MRPAILAALAVLSIGATAVRTDARPDDELARQVQELRERLAAQQATLEAQQSQIQSQADEIEKLRGQVPGDWLTEQRAEEIRGLVTEVLADADTRASLLQGGAIAGHDGKNFFIGSSDGNFLLKVGGQIQPRYIANFRDNAPIVFGGPPADDDEFGFQIRRVKLFFDGHVFDPKLTYRVQVAANRDTGGLDLEEGIIGYATNDELRLFVGRFADPLLRDSFTSNSRQLAVERSITSYVFAANDNYTEGFGADWRPGEAWRFRATLNDGIGSGNPGGTGNDFANDTTDFAVTGRVDWKVAGNWKQMDDYAAWSGEPTAVFIGAALHYEVAETGDNQLAAPGFDDFFVYTLDGSIEMGGFNAFAAIIGQQVNTIAIPNLNNFGFLVQAGYMIVPDKVEPFARYEPVDIDNAPEELGIITAGLNYYWHANTVKFTADVVYCLDPVTNATTFGALGATGTGLTGLGLLPDNPASDGQVAVRAQFQLLF
ncbi:MAG: OprO/OprP family phosphate-selective porin [Phycisphaerales bacterium]|nr:OprO/OprP family phosphate-selective porin [Phycisphaerales bacterium]